MAMGGQTGELGGRQFWCVDYGVWSGECESRESARRRPVVSRVCVGVLRRFFTRS